MQGVILLPLPEYPASARQPLSDAEPAVFPVPELLGHAKHAAAPVSDLKVSAAHGIGVIPFGPVYPASATHAMLDVEPVILLVVELLGQSVQASKDAATALYLSASHNVTPPPLPVKPASAKHPLSAAVPVPVPVPELVGQAPQLAADRTASLNVSTAHAVTVAPCPV